MTTTANSARPATRLGSIIALACLALMLVGITAMLVWPRLVQRNVSPIGGPFTLTTQTGEKLSDADLRGKPFAIVFGFTRCPEVCPTTLWETTEALKTLGPDADKLRVLFVSVDPTRDTPEFMARYLQSFDKHITGLTGTEAEIAAIGKEYRIYYRKVPTDDGDYTMDHTATMFLMDAEGQFSGTISYGEEMAMRVQKLRRLIGGSA
ncbi:SCO family protein [Mesorhizobium sp. B3-1-3]|uniref:SCO family protein n=1 Tax=unclassified Mesorhizobium TaxID=325217 RepID=UPI00112BC661|nr:MULTISPECIES: SCO family protein [unclassified Mesorhizobium]TPI64298.1 SCO family protein [Mesorhizobium sp. B3-1-8]TPI70222.1 SCO family protein [Mesorhizobium sp. B3-1-3]